VEQQNAEMRHQRMMFSQEFIDFNINLVQASYEKIREEWRRNGGKTGKGIRQESKVKSKANYTALIPALSNSQTGHSTLECRSLSTLARSFTNNTEKLICYKARKMSLGSPSSKNSF
jgi:hypothetical protein